jgi:hypothetical protein
VPNAGTRSLADQCRSNHHTTGSDNRFRLATLMGQFINAANAQTSRTSSVPYTRGRPARLGRSTGLYSERIVL